MKILLKKKTKKHEDFIKKIKR